MRKTCLQIKSRLDSLEASASEAPPPSYEDSLSPVPQAVHNTPAESHHDVTSLFHITDGVQIFFITPEGYVSAPSYPSSLTIYQFKDRAPRDDCASAFLQVGEWMYPLVVGQSPVLHSNWGAYLFPDLTAATPGINDSVIFCTGYST